jgi:hypothetical protein
MKERLYRSGPNFAVAQLDVRIDHNRFSPRRIREEYLFEEPVTNFVSGFRRPKCIFDPSHARVEGFARAHAGAATHVQICKAHKFQVWLACSRFTPFAQNDRRLAWPDVG